MITILNKTSEGWLYHQKIDDSRGQGRLPAGVYKLEWIDIGNGYLYGFDPITADNDQPLEVDSQALNLVKEMDTFFKREDVFKKFGFSHKRGYLLHGPPGCGKSCTLRLLQKHFVEKFDGIVLLWEKNDFENHLDALRNFEPNRPVMVICEDIDGVLEKFEKTVLEILDGQRALNKFVLVATTNYIDKVPSRIKDRPSRIDRLVEIGAPDLSTRLKYLHSLGIDGMSAEKLAEASNGLSIAKLKELVIATVCFEEPVDEVVKRLINADMTVKQKNDDPEG